KKLMDILHSNEYFPVSLLFGYIQEWKEKVELINRIQDLEAIKEQQQSDITFLKLENYRLDKITELIKLHIIDYSAIELPKSFSDMIEQCKKIGGITLYLERQKEVTTIWVKFANDLSIQKKNSFFELFSNFDVDNIEYEFKVKVTFEDLSDRYEPILIG
ncbi:MAG: hypothetical protein Q7J68_04015, partial [Thermoplasmata archaeon]|nr:hypothetical protein [Thermoplasmata archaeon]